MIIEQAFLDHGRSGHQRADLLGFEDRAVHRCPTDPIEITGHQLQACVAIGAAAAIVQGHPTGQFELLIVGTELRHIIGLPGQAAGQVAQFQIPLARFGAVQQHHQSRSVPQVGRYIGEHQTSGNAGLDAIFHPKHHAAVSRQNRRRFQGFGPGLGMNPHHLHRLAHVFFQ